MHNYSKERNIYDIYKFTNTFKIDIDEGHNIKIHV